MSTNFIQEGEILTFTAPVGGVVSGGAYLMGGMLVVANGDADAGDEFEGSTCGVFELAKTTTDVMTVGQEIYWDNTAFEFTTTDSGNYTQGTVVEAAGNTSETVKVKLRGFAVLVNP